MERDTARLNRLREQRPELYADYLANAERLRGHEAAQWAVSSRRPALSWAEPVVV